MAVASDVLKGITARTQQCITKCALLVLNHTDDEQTRKNHLASLKSMLHSSVEEGMRHSLIKEGLSQTQQLFQNDPELDISQFEDQYKQQYALLEERRDLKEEVDSHEAIRNFKKHILSIEEGRSGGTVNGNAETEDEDLVETQAELNLIDPISKKIMEEPVRHKHCGHVFDMKSVQSLKKKKFRCPQMGCVYRQPINMKDLEEALDYKREIERRKHAQ